MIATQPKSRQLLGVNQQSYQLLKASLELHLRRQLLIAVCDSVVMQNQMATQLEADLAKARAIPCLPSGLEEYGLEEQGFEEQGFEEYDAIAARQKQPLARLIFDPSDGNLPKQVAQWVRQTTLAEGVLPQVQVLGIEQMTRQPAITQNHFLRSLEKIDALLPRLNTSLLIWVPWPWLRTIQQSAPTFWNWRNGVFEFVSDPTPVTIEPQRLSPASVPALASKATPPHPTSESTANLAANQTSSTSSMKPSTSSASVEAVIEDEDDLSSLFAEEYAAVESPLKNTAQSTAHNAVGSGAVGSGAFVPSRIFPSRSVELYGETAEHQRTIDVESVSVPPENAQRSTARRSLATSGGLASIVTKGINSDATNSDVEDTALNVNRSAELSPATDKQLSSPKDPLANARSYRARIEAGDRTLAVIESAIAAYESELELLGEASPDWSAGLNDLGTLYWLQAQQVEASQQSIASMTRSIELYQDALKRLQQDQTALVGQLYSNMGAVYSMLATYQDSADYLNQAVSAYLQALPTCSLETDPLEYATLHNSLGSVYWKLSHYEQAQSSLLKAVSAYRNALSGYRPDAQPLDYAAAQNNLGITYWSLAKHEDPAVCLKQAISAYSDALNYRTPDADPAACAITYNNLALAYWDLSKVKNIEQSRAIQAQKNAITAFEAALNVSRNSGALNNMDSTAIYHCLGDVHGQMAETVSAPEEISASLGKSLYSYIQSLHGISNDAPAYAGRIGAIVANLRAHYTHLGLEGQQAALNKVPSDLIAPVLAAL